jgi:fused signal recognition particle receptor
MFRHLTLFAIVLALITVLMGTYVRLEDAGLGCVDWPGCGVGPNAEPSQSLDFGSLHFDRAPEWIAAAHRWLAMGLLGVVAVLGALTITLKERRVRCLILVFEALVLVGLESWLGTWVIRLQLLPMVVTAHLGVAFLILAVLQRLYCTAGPDDTPLGNVPGLRLLSRIALPLLFLQVLLGGWVSSHYATYSCPDFPTCLQSWWPDMDFVEAFYPWRGLEDYPWTLLSPPARVAIAMAHRLGALVVFLVLLALSLGVLFSPRVPHLRRPAILLLGLVVVQVVLGAEIVMLRLPLPVALAHTGVAALMMLALVKIHYRVCIPPLRVPAARPVPKIPVERPAPIRPVPRPVPEPVPVPQPAPRPVPTPLEEVPAQPTPEGLFVRLRNQLGKTRGGLTGVLATLALGRKAIDRELLDDIEAQLLMADIGVSATREIIDHLTESLERHQLDDIGALSGKLREYLYEILEPVSLPLNIPEEVRPFVILVVGVNGVGKTTTIGKLAKRLQNAGHSVMLAAGDTFRAAAVEQLQTWGERNGVPVIAQQTGADSASVIYDALQAAQARGIDVLIADTAGRLHTKSNLMEELSKIKRIMARLDPNAPHEVLLVLDAGTGQNAINQARQFNDAVGLTGIALTKLDGTAKGGVIFALAKQFGIPIRFIGIGETIDDLQDFDAKNFINALFEE